MHYFSDVLSDETYTVEIYYNGKEVAVIDEIEIGNFLGEEDDTVATVDVFFQSGTLTLNKKGTIIEDGDLVTYKYNSIEIRFLAGF